MNPTDDQVRAIQAVNAEMRQLEADGRWTRDEYLRLHEKLRQIAPDLPDVTSTLNRHANIEWRLHRRTLESRPATVHS